MPVKGELAPDFEATTSAGSPFKLSALRGAPVVLYFFPKAGTPGCTRESIGFSHYYDAFRNRGVQVIGVSVDPAEAQQRFAEKCSLPFPLVADREREVARLYGVLGAFGHARRATFLLDPQGRVVEVIQSILPGVHVQRARDVFLTPQAPPAVGH